jgi:hypothetical protein
VVDAAASDGDADDVLERRRQWLAKKGVEQSRRLDKINHRVQNLLLRFEHGEDSAGNAVSDPAAASAAAASAQGFDEDMDVEKQSAEDQFFTMYISKYKVDGLFKAYGRSSDTRDQMLLSLDHWIEGHVEKGVEEILSDEEDEEEEAERLKVVEGTLKVTTPINAHPRENGKKERKRERKNI